MNKIYTFLIALMVIPVMQINAQSEVTFKVDITDYLESTPLGENGIRIGGNFAANNAVLPDWTPSAAECGLTQEGETNIWSITVAFPASSVDSILEYKFVNNDWGTNEGTSESAIETGGCGTDDGGGNINRTLTIPASNITVEFCWEKCESCAVASVNETSNSFKGINIFPNPAKDFVNVNFTTVEPGTVSIEIYNTLGQRVALEQLGFRTAGANTHQINLNAMNHGVYFVKINNGLNSIIQKVAVN